MRGISDGGNSNQSLQGPAVAIYLDESVKVFGFEWSSPFEEMFFFWFLYITHLAVKNYKSKNEYGIKK